MKSLTSVGPKDRSGQRAIWKYAVGYLTDRLALVSTGEESHEVSLGEDVGEATMFDHGQTTESYAASAPGQHPR